MNSIISLGAYEITIGTVYKTTVIGLLTSILGALAYIVWWISN